MKLGMWSRLGPKRVAEGWRFERARPVHCVPYEREALPLALAKTERGYFVPEGYWRQ